MIKKPNCGDILGDDIMDVRLFFGGVFFVISILFVSKSYSSDCISDYSWDLGFKKSGISVLYNSENDSDCVLIIKFQNQNDYNVEVFWDEIIAFGEGNVFGFINKKNQRFTILPGESQHYHITRITETEDAFVGDEILHLGFKGVKILKDSVLGDVVD